MMVRVEHGDCREIVPALGVQVDAIVTDPPYNLASIVKRFGAKNAVPAKSADHARLARGFMGLQWDGTEIAFDPETWRTLATALRPGGFLLAFGGTRTSHRMVCAIENAGFVIQDTIAWMYGSGFPKRRDMIKPAFEPICVAYKPGGKRTLQVDECRIPTNGEDMGDPGRFLPSDANLHAGWQRPHKTNTARMAECANERFAKAGALGRWPANVIHDGSDEVMEGFPYSAGQQGDVRGSEPSQRLGSNGIYGEASSKRPAHPKRDGEASQARRYTQNGGTDFAALPGMRREATSAARFFYCAKADKQDRWGSRHPTVKPVELIRYLVKLVCPPGGTFLDPFAGSGTAGVAALAEGRNAILIEQDAGYIADIRDRLAFYEGEGRHSLASKQRNAVTRPGLLL